MTTWNNSIYANHLRIVNSETIAILRRYWIDYSSANNVSRSFVESYKNSVKRIYDQHHKDGLSNESCMQNTKRFWENGTVDTIISDTPSKRSSLNPTFAYSDAMGTQFSVHQDTSPLVGFHIILPSQLTPFFQDNRDKPEVLDEAVRIAKDQFKVWCTSFRQFVVKSKSKSRKLVIRFFVGDAIAFCKGLQGRREPVDTPNCYSRPLSTVPLRLNGEDYRNGSNKSPLTFDVIDTGYLIDRVGLLNLFPNSVFALTNASSILYTNTSVQDATEESNLLSNFLCGDVSVMCTLLGIMPVPYACGVTNLFSKARWYKVKQIIHSSSSFR